MATHHNVITISVLDKNHYCLQLCSDNSGIVLHDKHKNILTATIDKKLYFQLVALTSSHKDWRKLPLGWTLFDERQNSVFMAWSNQGALAKVTFGWHLALNLYFKLSSGECPLTHWGRGMHICVSKLTIIGWDNGLSPGWCQAIIWASCGILLIGPLGTNFSEILIGIQTFSYTEIFESVICKMTAILSQPRCVNMTHLCGWNKLSFYQVNFTSWNKELFLGWVSFDISMKCVKDPFTSSLNSETSAQTNSG